MSNTDTMTKQSGSLWTVGCILADRHSVEMPDRLGAGRPATSKHADTSTHPASFTDQATKATRRARSSPP